MDKPDRWRRVGELTAPARLCPGEPILPVGRTEIRSSPARFPMAMSSFPIVMAAAVCAALQQRRETGRGAHIDASMYEICVQQMRDAILQAQAGDATAAQRQWRFADFSPRRVCGEGRGSMDRHRTADRRRLATLPAIREPRGCGGRRMRATRPSTAWSSDQDGNALDGCTCSGRVSPPASFRTSKI